MSHQKKNLTEKDVEEYLEKVERVRPDFIIGKGTAQSPNPAKVGGFKDLTKIGLRRHIDDETTKMHLSFAVKEVFDEVMETRERVDRELYNYKITGYVIDAQNLVRVDVREG